MARWIKVNGEETYPDPANGTDYSLAEMREAIGGGYIEVLELESGEIMVLDEEGKLKGLPVNLLATAMTRGLLSDSDLIVGDVLAIRDDQIE